jgi:hypothetical protein
MNLHNTCGWIGACLLCAGALTVLTRHTQFSRACYALGAGAFYIGDASVHDVLGQWWNAAYSGFWAWLWWRGGGGDNTKRRLRRLRKKFTPVRRTAPAAT